MKNLTLTTRLGLLAIILVAPIAGISAANLLDYGNTRNEANVGTGVDVNAGANVNTRGNADVGLTSTSSGGIDIDARGQGQGQADIRAGGSVEADADVEITINRRSAEVRNNISARLQPGSISTRADLRAFAAAEVREDENLNHLTFSDDRIEVGYRERGRFFGIIPVNLNVTAIVASDGRVLVHYPWYRFLVVTNREEIAAQIESEVDAFFESNIGTEVQSNASATGTANANINSSARMSGRLTASQQAELASRIRAILEANLVTEGGAATTTQAD